MKYWIMCCLLFLAGCSSTREPTIKVETQIVKVPVVTYCINKSDIPAKENYITIKIKKQDDPVVKIRKLKALTTQQDNYNKLLLDLLNNCSEINKE